MRLVRTTALLASIAVGAALAGTVRATADTGVAWAPCAENGDVQCATVTVPVDWAQPSGETIEVAIARRAAAHPKGTLFMMPGGPGGSGVDQLLAPDGVPPELAGKFDVVSFDPRGTNRSHPVMCDGDLAANPPETSPDAGATFASVAAYSKALGESCRERSGSLVDHVDNVSVAKDIDAIRAALGEEQLSLYGVSYGTLTGQMYAERFPSRVRALVLDSVFDHSLSPARFLNTEAAAGEDAFGEFASWCARTSSCAVPGRDARQAYSDRYERAAAGDLDIGPMDLVQQTLGFFYGPSWSAAAEYLAAKQTGTRAAGADAPFAAGAFCGDHRVRVSSEREWLSLWRMQKRFAPTMRSHFAWPLVSMCAAWPAKVANPQHRPDIDVPVLVLNSRHDPATGYSWALHVTHQLPRAVLLTYDGWGHGVGDRSECTLSATTRYLVTLELPRPGTHCAGVPPSTTATRASAPAKSLW